VVVGGTVVVVVGGTVVVVGGTVVVVVVVGATVVDVVVAFGGLVVGVLEHPASRTATAMAAIATAPVARLEDGDEKPPAYMRGSLTEPARPLMGFQGLFWVHRDGCGAGCPRL
jgi:hypothetical protein